jgi:hypothetical protein
MSRRLFYFSLLSIFLTMSVYSSLGWAGKCRDKARKKSGAAQESVLKVKLASGKTRNLAAITREKLAEIEQAIWDIEIDYGSERLQIAWGHLGFDYGPCGCKADIIRHFLVTGNPVFRYPESGKRDAYEEKLLKMKPVVADSLLVNLYNKNMIQFNFEYVLADGTTFKPYMGGVPGEFYASRSWGNHTAVLLNVEGQLTVLDPALGKARPFDEWLYAYSKKSVKFHQLTESQAHDLNMAIYTGDTFGKKSKSIAAGYAFLSRYALPNGNAMGLWDYMRNDIARHRSENNLPELTPEQLDQLIKGSHIKVTRRK